MEHTDFFPEQTHLVSGYTRDRTDRWMAGHSDPDDAVFQSNDDIRHVIDNAPRRIRQKADVLLDHLIRRSDHFGKEVPVIPKDDYTLGYAKNTDEFVALLGFLQEARYIRSCANDAYEYIVTAFGQEHAERRKTSNTESSLVFVAMRFSDEMNQVWDDGIMPAIKGVGFDPRRVDLEEHNDDVIDRMLGMIRESRFVVADFTDHHNGVYFEAGFARGLGVPVIWCCKADDIADAHFDTNHFNHVVWSSADDLAEKLANRILATIGRGDLKTNR